ncbi:hypothetical protein BHE74_00059449 [Ensete ventricosum]|nr:hypothetical protein BHE74_00059449 [Ensete ventricosum]
MFTARYGQYIPVRQVAGTRTARHWAVPPKIDCRRSISVVGGRLKEEIDRRRSIEGERSRRPTVGGRLSEKKGGRRRRGKRRKKRKEEKKYLSPARGRRSRAVAARGLWALFLPRGEKD